jgi:hypothetical protein
MPAKSKPSNGPSAIERLGATVNRVSAPLRAASIKL